MLSDAWLQRLPPGELARLRGLLRDGRTSFARWRRHRLGLRGALLYLLALPLLPAAVVGLARGDLTTFLAASTAFALTVGAARLNRRGLLERRLAAERRFTRSARFPFQQAAVALLAAGTALAAHLVAAHGLFASVLFGGLAAGGMVLAYDVPGWRQLRDYVPKRIADPTIRSAVQDAENRLLAIERSALSIGNADLERHLLRIVGNGHAILAQLADRPDDLYRARRFFNVHLEGAERVAVAYARSHRVLRGGPMEAKFRDVLEQIEAAFRRQHRRLLHHEMDDLDIQIDVLRKQLQREGLA